MKYNWTQTSSTPILIILILALVVLSARAWAGIMSSLTTTNAGGNGQDGDMFNAAADKTVMIKKLNLNWQSGSLAARVYYLRDGYITKRVTILHG